MWWILSCWQLVLTLLTFCLGILHTASTQDLDANTGEMPGCIHADDADFSQLLLRPW